MLQNIPYSATITLARQKIKGFVQQPSKPALGAPFKTKQQNSEALWQSDVHEH